MKILVLGAGLIGLGCAWQLRQAGHAVTVFDPAPGTGACAAAAGMLAPVSELVYGEEDGHKLAASSLQMFPEFVHDVERCSGRSAGLRSTGTIVVGANADDLAVVHDIAQLHDHVGVGGTRLLPSQIRTIEPGISPRIRGGVHIPNDFQVDPPALHAALLAAFGDNIHPQKAVAVTSGAVTTDDGVTHHCDVAIVATGARAAELVPQLPIRPVLGSTIELATRHGAPVCLRHTVRTVVQGRSAYIVPTTGDRIILGASTAERGFEHRPTLTELYDLIRPAIEVVPELGDMEFVSVRTGWRPTTPDHIPIVGFVAPGVLVATGHWRHGVLLTPWTSRVVCDLVAHPDQKPDSVYGPARFGLGKEPKS